MGTKGYLDDVAVAHVGDFETKYYEYLDAHHASLVKTLADKKALNEDIESELKTAINAFKDQFKADLGV